MVRYFIDTNIFLRTLIKEDIKIFADCYKILEAIKLNKIRGLTSNLVLAEIVWTLSSYYNFSKENIIKALKSIINLRGLKIVDNYQSHVAVSFYEKRSVKYIDAVISSIKQIETKKWVVVSYDQDFDKLGVLRKEPSLVLQNL